MEEEMILDVDNAYEFYKLGFPHTTKTQFLEKIGMSWQTAGNLQSSKSKQKVLQYANKIKQLTGLSMDEIIKPLEK